MHFFISYLWENPRLFFSVSLIVVFSICCHEFMHAFVSLKMGDSTAADRGHLTLNPFKQMGVFSLLLMCLFGIAWGSVPATPSLIADKHKRALVYFSGPATNLLLSQFFLLVCFICVKCGVGDSFAVNMLLHGGILNIVMFLLNMLPLQGLDGFGILSSYLPGFLKDSSEVMRGAYFIVIALLFVFFNKLFQVAGVVAAAELYFLQWLIQ